MKLEVVQTVSHSVPGGYASDPGSYAYILVVNGYAQVPGGYGPVLDDYTAISRYRAALVAKNQYVVIWLFSQTFEGAAELLQPVTATQSSTYQEDGPYDGVSTELTTIVDDALFIRRSFQQQSALTERQMVTGTSVTHNQNLHPGLPSITALQLL